MQTQILESRDFGPLCSEKLPDRQAVVSYLRISLSLGNSIVLINYHGRVVPSLGQELARSSDCLLCYSPFFLARL